MPPPPPQNPGNASVPVLHHWELARVPFRVRADQLIVGAQHWWVSLGASHKAPCLLALQLSAKLRLDSCRSLPAAVRASGHLEIPAEERNKRGVPLCAQFCHTFSFPISIDALPVASTLELTVKSPDLGCTLGRVRLPLFDDAAVMRQGRLLLPLEGPGRRSKTSHSPPGEDSSGSTDRGVESDEAFPAGEKTTCHIQPETTSADSGQHSSSDNNSNNNNMISSSLSSNNSSTSSSSSSSGSSDDSSEDDESEDQNCSCCSSCSSSGVLLSNDGEVGADGEQEEADGFLLIDSPAERLVHVADDPRRCRHHRRRRRLKQEPRKYATASSNQVAACFRAMSWFKLLDLQVRRQSKEETFETREHDVDRLSKYCERDLRRACDSCAFLTVSCYALPAPVLHTSVETRKSADGSASWESNENQLCPAGQRSSRPRTHSAPDSTTSRGLYLRSQSNWLSLRTREAAIQSVGLQRAATQPSSLATGRHDFVERRRDLLRRCLLALPTSPQLSSGTSTCQLWRRQQRQLLGQEFRSCATPLLALPALVPLGVLSQTPPWIEQATRAPELLCSGIPAAEVLAFAANVDWSNAQEADRAAAIIVALPPVPLEGALSLLGQQPSAVREYGRRCLSQASDAEVLHFLPQLVQAVRYDAPGLSASVLSTVLKRASACPRVASAFHWALASEAGDAEQEHLFLRGSQRLFKSLSEASEGSMGRLALRVLEQQRRFVSALRSIASKIRLSKDRAERRTERLQQLLTEEGPGSALLDVSEAPFPLPISPYGLFLGVVPERCKVIRSSQYPLLLSCRLLLPPGEDTDGFSSVALTQGSANEAQLRSMGCREEVREYLFKSGDDLRQDQLATRLIKLIRDLLTQYGCDYHMVVYEAVPLSRTDGLIEFVPDSVPLSTVKKNFNSLRSFFATAAEPKTQFLAPAIGSPIAESSVESTDAPALAVVPGPGDLAAPPPPSSLVPVHQQQQQTSNSTPAAGLNSGSGVEVLPPAVLGTFVKSCAAYSVITFLLGVGDRHLDNLLVCRGGQFFHVDFGFILGEDPKPFPPPMKLCNEIVEALGGLGSEKFTTFQLLCCQCFRCIRRHARVVNDVLLLMEHSGVQSLCKGPAALARVRERFQLHVSEVEAEGYLLDVINVSVNALFPAVVDKIHEWALYWR